MSLRVQTAAPPPALACPTPREHSLAPALMQAFVDPRTGMSPAQRLLEPGALAVTTGQQPGLFSGPLLTIHKALSAAALACLLEERWERPVVPVFWVAGDDHDFVESAQAWWAGSDGEPVHGTLRERAADAPMVPMYREPLGAEIDALLDRFAEALPPSDFRDPTLGALRYHYRPEATVAAGFAGLLAEWLAPFGIAVFDPTHAVAKRAQGSVLLQALTHAHSLERVLVEQSAMLAAAGRAVDIPVGDGATLVMLEAGQGRDRLLMAGEGFVTRRSHERFTLDELRRIAEDSPERLSANVLLRPVVESALLPTIAYLAGPAELRYLALAEALYAPLAVRRQLPLPRWSGMLVEARVDRVLEKFHATIPELIEPGQRLEARVVREQLPPETEASLRRLREEIERGYEALAQAAIAIDPTIERTVRNLGQQALAGTADAEKRLVNHLKKRQTTETQQISRVRQSILPAGHPQERVLTGAAWLARHGPAVLEMIHQAALDWYRSGLETSEREG